MFVISKKINVKLYLKIDNVFKKKSLKIPWSYQKSETLELTKKLLITTELLWVMEITADPFPRNVVTIGLLSS